MFVRISVLIECLVGSGIGAVVLNLCIRLHHMITFVPSSAPNKKVTDNDAKVMVFKDVLQEFTVINEK